MLDRFRDPACTRQSSSKPCQGVSEYRRFVDNGFGSPVIVVTRLENDFDLLLRPLTNPMNCFSSCYPSSSGRNGGSQEEVPSFLRRLHKLQPIQVPRLLEENSRKSGAQDRPLQPGVQSLSLYLCFLVR